MHECGNHCFRHSHSKLQKWHFCDVMSINLGCPSASKDSLLANQQVYDTDTHEVIAGSPADYREHDYVGDASARSTWDTMSRQDQHSWRDSAKAVAEAAIKRKKHPQ